MSRTRRCFGLPAALVIAGVLLVGCGDDGGSDDGGSSDTTGAAGANPASEFCVDEGGEVDIVDEDDGQVGYCVLPDGTRVDEWEYFRENADG